MAKKAASTPKTPSKSFEQTLWNLPCVTVRGSVESSEYKPIGAQPHLPQVRQRQFEERRQELTREGKQNYLDMVEFYTMKNVFYLPEAARTVRPSRPRPNRMTSHFTIDTALHTVEKTNKTLRGACRTTALLRLGLDASKLATLIDSRSATSTVAARKRMWSAKVRILPQAVRRHRGQGRRRVLHPQVRGQCRHDRRI